VEPISRRTAIAGTVAALVASPAAAQRAVSPSWDAVVVGAGVFGAWTAERLREAGQKVLLVDAWGPAHARASSGGESRMTRSDYGADEIYTRMATDSLPHWKALSDEAGLPLFHRTGVLFLFQKEEPYARDSIAVHRKLGLPLDVFDREQLRARYSQIALDDIAFGLFEAEFGALMARRAVQTLVDRFVRAGGTYRQARIVVPDPAARLEGLRTADGELLRASRFIFACGPWLPRLLPDVLGERIFPTRQEVFFFAPPGGERRFAPDRLPGWADFNGGDLYYGFPDLEARGFKIAHDTHGPPIDPDTGDRIASADGLARIRRYLARRFPPLAEAPLVETRVCQYENSANGDFLIDRHPSWDNAVLVGGGSGHGFKHGPEVGRYAAALALGRLAAQEPRFSLASKGTRQNRSVH
jgi:monomeric sarcosine oxidase